MVPPPGLEPGRPGRSPDRKSGLSTDSSTGGKVVKEQVGFEPTINGLPGRLPYHLATAPQPPEGGWTPRSLNPRGPRARRLAAPVPSFCS